MRDEFETVGSAAQALLLARVVARLRSVGVIKG